MALPDQLKLASEAIARICERNHVAELSVFGSTARGDGRSDSDVDLLVTFRPDAHVGLIGFNGLRRELEGILGCRVDLIPKDGLKPLIRDQVLAESRVVYAV